MLRIDRLDDQAKDVFSRAYHVCQRFNSSRVDVEHYLLALLEQAAEHSEGVVAQLLERLAVDLNAVIGAVEATLDAKPKALSTNQTHVVITPQIKRILERAVAEAGAAMVAPEDLLLALASDANAENSVTALLAQYGLTHERIAGALQQFRDEGLP